MLNWIDKNERLPTKEDASEDGYVYAVGRTGKVILWHPSSLHESLTHWLRFREMPIPKRWRTPTIHDLAKAGKPIPCRARKDKFDWKNLVLVSIIVIDDYKWPFLCKCPLNSNDLGFQGYEFCEICDD